MTQSFTFTIATTGLGDTSEQRASQVAHLLRVAAVSVEELNIFARVRDPNGNRVGFWAFEEVAVAAPPARVLYQVTAADAEELAGRALSGDELDQIARSLPHSSISESVENVVDAIAGPPDDEDEDDDGPAAYPDHNNDIGDWCPWSGEPREGSDSRCPAGCRRSATDDTDG